MKFFKNFYQYSKSKCWAWDGSVNKVLSALMSEIPSSNPTRWLFSNQVNKKRKKIKRFWPLRFFFSFPCKNFSQTHLNFHQTKASSIKTKKKTDRNQLKKQTRARTLKALLQVPSLIHVNFSSQKGGVRRRGERERKVVK